jgi:Fic family protein
MTEVRKSGNYEQWIKFFLNAVRETAVDAIDTIDKLTEIHNRSLELIKNESPLLNEKLNEFLSYLEHHPIIDTKKTADALGCSYNTTAKYIDILCKKGILVQSSKVGKNKIFSYSSYLEILRKNA